MIFRNILSYTIYRDPLPVLGNFPYATFLANIVGTFKMSIIFLSCKQILIACYLAHEIERWLPPSRPGYESETDKNV